MRLISAGSLVRAQSGPPAFARSETDSEAATPSLPSRRSAAKADGESGHVQPCNINAASFRRRFQLWRDKTTRQATISIFQFWILDCRLLISRNAFPVRQSGGLVPWQAFLIHPVNSSNFPAAYFPQ